MPNVHVVTYDISDDKRRTEVFKTLKGWGDWIQYSVFRCELSPMGRVDLEALLSEIINHRQDQVLFVDLGPVGGRGDTCISGIGRIYHKPNRGPLIF